MLLYAWGANRYGQLGLGYKSEVVIQPRVVDMSTTNLKADNIVSIAGGTSHTLILDKNGSAILKCGKQFVWGNNRFAQLGLSKNIISTGIPSWLQLSPRLATGFRQVSCGYRHTAMITQDRGLLVAGTGSKGQLGIGDNYDDNGYMTISRIPELANVISIASGQYHTICLKEDGNVFGWGENKYGQIGIDPKFTNIYLPAKVLTNNTLTKLCAGWTHSAALTKHGDVYTWGRNNSGQLGSPRVHPHKPERIPLTNITDLSIGSDHNMAITEDKSLYVWGCNDTGSCGTGDFNHVMRPTKILSQHKVKYAFACMNSSFAVVE
ncbi:uncharacterized protein LOC109595131 isoform X2 [Aethina tumida]|uniref:uncharacterized protein LOC109595131 isoform X2 n=1 Tax=Aethina tumida TaxID=116153 RepID=UPI00096B32E7|nr:uncharacterized protein LOC109595131 isoform X2 [Aethina tumida]